MPLFLWYDNSNPGSMRIKPGASTKVLFSVFDLC